MQSDLHKIISSPQMLTQDHVKLFLYQILRGKSVYGVFVSVVNRLKTKFRPEFRREVSTLVGNHSSRHQARQLVGQFELPAQDMRLWTGARGRVQQEPRDDPRGGHAVLSRA